MIKLIELIRLIRVEEVEMGEYLFPYEKFEVWKQAKELAVKIYRFTEKFPSEEKFGMVSQLRRAAIYVASNLPEESSRNSKKNQAHFLQIS